MNKNIKKYIFWTLVFNFSISFGEEFKHDSRNLFIENKISGFLGVPWVFSIDEEIILRSRKLNIYPSLFLGVENTWLYFKGNANIGLSYSKNDEITRSIYLGYSITSAATVEPTGSSVGMNLIYTTRKYLKQSKYFGTIKSFGIEYLRIKIPEINLNF